MIIVSQDKSVIVNFNNVEAIEIGNIEENQCKGTIYARLVSDYFYKIGEYKTEERAKQVLQEIIELYRKDTFYKETQIDSGVYSRKEINHPLPKVYEMPEV